jgi:signal transduction histidine kinase
VATLHVSHFQEMIERFPDLVTRLVGIMSDRIRTTTRDEQQRGKLIALGKMSAGLAHELNNPAAAAVRAAESLRLAVACMRASELTIDRLGLPAEERARLNQAELELLAAPPEPDHDPLERSDREQTLGDWLESRDVPHAWQLASTLADAGLGLAQVNSLVDTLPAEVSGAVLNRLGASLSVDNLIAVIESSSQRISELVRAIKEYSYMDQGPEQEIDVHDGIENTLLILGHRLKQNVHVTREFDRTLPKICAFGRELNQVWTNLFVNALDAMHDHGELLVRTSREGNRVLVEVIDSGPGIPAEAQPHLFKQFFTTKGPGEGTGLGLEMAARIIRKHRGEITFETKPGRTNFQVRLPMQK